jgi:HD-like signal output (HDOD) protein/ActR/RegA family two-component response regulator
VNISSTVEKAAPRRADDTGVIGCPNAETVASSGGTAPRVLFVDDDARILTGVERTVRRTAPGWHARFALGGDAALELIGAERFDAIVCDLGMPGINGVAVLKQARERQPDAARIVLSAGAGPTVALEAARIAHRYVAKPYRDEDLVAVVARACGLRTLLREEGWRRAAGGVIALPSCPRLYTELTELTVDPDASAADAAALMERDVAMSAKILQLVNSAFFGIGRRISRTAEAVHYVGLETLRALVLHAAAFEAFAPTRPIDGFDLGALQRGAQLAARIARRLATAPHTRDHAFTAGLLHGVGLLVLAREDPYELAESIADARRGGLALHEVEYARHGSSHAELGAYVLGLWGLPEPIVDAIAHQHRLAHLAPAAADPALAVHAATVVAGGLSPAVPGAAAPALDVAALTAAGVAERVAEWRALAAAEAGPA